MNQKEEDDDCRGQGDASLYGVIVMGNDDGQCGCETEQKADDFRIIRLKQIKLFILVETTSFRLMKIKKEKDKGYSKYLKTW